MATQPTGDQQKQGIIARTLELAWRVAGWVDERAFRSQLGPTRDPERRDFIPARRR
jgi:hypothetical protein